MHPDWPQDGQMESGIIRAFQLSSTAKSEELIKLHAARRASNERGRAA